MGLLPTRLDGTVTLPDGRRLGFAEFGHAEGFPVLWFHGTPGARHQVPPLARAYGAENEVRIIGVERPGIGRSSDHQYPDVAAFAHDIEVLVDRLGFDRFGVIGLSGGGPYTLAVAHHMPERVVAAGVLGGVVPTVGDEDHLPPTGILPLARRLNAVTPGLVVPLGFLLQGIAQGLKPVRRQIYSLIADIMPPGDRVVFRSEGVEEMFVGDLIQGSKLQCRAVGHDVVVFGRHWGFDPTGISVPVYWWHGDNDPIVPHEPAIHLTERMPAATFHLRPGESHLGGFGIADEVLDAVTSHR